MTLTEHPLTRTEAMTRLAPRDTVPLKLGAYAAIHDAILRDLARLECRTGRAAAGVGPELDRAGLQRWWARFERNIEHHHEREDDLLFPLLLERGVALDVAGLTGDHDVLDVLMADVRHGLADAPVADLAAAAAALRAHMDDHLTREELEVFPAVDAHVSAEEYAEIEAEMRKGLPLREMAFTLPWIADELHPRLLAHMQEELPAPLLALDRLVWQRRYARTAAPLLAVVR